VTPAYDLDFLGRQPTVAGEFIREVGRATDLAPDTRRRIIITGLRALDGRSDLEVL
jgi:hypothetical protein